MPVSSLHDRLDDIPYRIRGCRLETGERLPLVIGPQGVPASLPNQWSLFVRRPSVQLNTLLEDLGTVAHIYNWALQRRIDLDERLASGQGLSPDEIRSLYQNLRYTRGFGRQSASLRINEIRKATVVTGKVHATRVGTAREYLVWAMERVLFRFDPGDPRVPDVRERCERFQRLAQEYQRDCSDDTLPHIGLTNEQRVLLLSLVRPDSATNPFNRPVRFRNYVVFALMLAFGFRRSEILKVYLSDVNVKGRDPFIRIKRRPDDPNDPRGVTPSVKTLGREVRLIPHFARLLDTYIQHHRPNFLGSENSPFLFFSSWGRPLSLRMVNAMTEQLCRRSRAFQGILTPHVLRYTANDMLVEAAQRTGLDDARFKQAQNYLFGWSGDSEQGAEYSRRSIERIANDLLVDHQRSLFT
jgi:integrase